MREEQMCVLLWMKVAKLLQLQQCYLQQQQQGKQVKQ
jgi:hypothetical protein